MPPCHRALSHDLHVFFVVEHFTDATSKKRLIVDDQNARPGASDVG